LIERFGPKWLGYTINYQLLNAAITEYPKIDTGYSMFGIKGQENLNFQSLMIIKLTAKDGISDLEGSNHLRSLWKFTSK
jgi:hypothetical protein